MATILVTLRCSAAAAAAWMLQLRRCCCAAASLRRPLALLTDSQNTPNVLGSAEYCLSFAWFRLL
ncbi:hypothetical protein BIFGAL_04422 [Bifidobacterium gallicum DSM 20093 = LMG 11596]|uniref:Secreted protein n=1 Tax=Bifidobacterium gallicum DSM 20093 = LMG 11596 TaxID=561180 RepID=D1NX13_9BIFI|nr:hypothetical protein BIFGAL_04422 [Bifidobacterium gallicum DSM 20093 = LMG 11596]